MANNVPGTSFSISLRVLGGPPCNADICCRRLAPLFAARRSRRSRALVCVGVSPGTAPVEEAAADESAMVQCGWCGVVVVWLCWRERDELSLSGRAEVIVLGIPSSWPRALGKRHHHQHSPKAESVYRNYDRVLWMRRRCVTRRRFHAMAASCLHSHTVAPWRAVPSAGHRHLDR
jgi:hypothetical protein